MAHDRLAPSENLQFLASIITMKKANLAILNTAIQAAYNL